LAGTAPQGQTSGVKRRAGRIGWLLAGAASGLLLACTEAPEIVVLDQEGTVTSLSEARCGSGGILCGSACCPAGNTCTFEGRCSPDKSCTTSEECSADSMCGDGRCVPWSAFPDEAAFDPDCQEGVDSADVPRALPDLTVSVNPAVGCLSNQARAQIFVRLCNRGALELPGGRAHATLVDAAEPSRSLCELVGPNVLRPGACESLECEVDAPRIRSGFGITILADPAESVAECSEGENNTALLSDVYCERVP